MIIFLFRPTDNFTTCQITANALRILAKGLDKKDKVVSAVDEMQESIWKKTFAGKYNAFTKHMTIFALFIPALSVLLMKQRTYLLLGRDCYVK